jgi:2-polyprenyl-3-methyl-5-hydroxy-6-metoxy-1,4-benzoquinol methylase
MSVKGSDKDKNEQEYIEGWEKVYSQKKTPFDVNELDEWVVELEAQRKVSGLVLDSGCGTGDNAIYLASKGHPVLGIDISEKDIEKAKEKAAEKGIENAEFLQLNIFKLTGYDGKLGSVIDTGCFHSLHEADRDREKYALMLKKACRAGAVIFLRAFSTANAKRTGYRGPQVYEEQIRVAFSNGWRIDMLGQKDIDVKLSTPKSVKTNALFAEITRL